MQLFPSIFIVKWLVQTIWIFVSFMIQTIQLNPKFYIYSALFSQHYSYILSRESAHLKSYFQDGKYSVYQATALTTLIYLGPLKMSSLVSIVCIHVHVCVCMCVYMCVYVCACVYMCVCVRVCVFQLLMGKVSNCYHSILTVGPCYYGISYIITVVSPWK